MQFITIAQTVAILALITTSTVNARQTEIVKRVSHNLPASPVIQSKSNNLDDDNLLSCKTDTATYTQTISSQTSSIKKDKTAVQSLKYLNSAVKTRYTAMRNEVIHHVTMKVAIALLNFTVDGFAAENIATYVSDGTQPFLPFEFANGVKITAVTPKDGTIVYRTEIPVAKNHSLAISLAVAGMISAASTVCNDMQMVDDLLGRDVLIQYDYYDANGIFFSSFTING